METGHGGLRSQAALDHINTFRGSLLQMKMKEGTVLKWFILLFCQGLIARVKLLVVANCIFSAMEKEGKKKSGNWRKFSPLDFNSEGLLGIWI